MADAPRRRFITTFEDSQRWRHVTPRRDDIVICTPPKSGTTWMQGIVRSVLWPGGDTPGTTGDLSPWVDARFRPIESVVELLEAQTHRRFLKSHSPGDCIPFEKMCKYIVVYRDGRDTLLSWANHRAKMQPYVVEALNAEAQKAGVSTVEPIWNGDIDTLFDEWELMCSPITHLAPWWPRRHEPNVLFVHYADLLADLSGEMKRIAAFLDVQVPEHQWPEVVDRCSLVRMRSDAHESGRMDAAWKGGAAAFFNKGINGSWVQVLNESQLERYEDLVRGGLPPDAAEWLELGSLALERRPDDDPIEVVQPTQRPHPIFGRIARGPAGAIEAMTERRVEKARDDGFFDDLPGHGKPIPDIDQHRPPGWFAKRFVQTERNKVKALQLEAELRDAMPALWRLETEALVVDRVEELNALVHDYNRVTSLQPMAELDVASMVAQWERLRKR